MDPMLVLLIALCLYLFPTVIAALRGHHNTMAIFVLNLMLGWTLLGWIGALVWSFTAPRRLLAND
jgi:hypothetical protein